MTYHNNDATIVQEWMNFQGNIIMPVFQYKIPVILLDKNTPKEAVCQVFENVNTGGVSLTVFELITAVFAMDDFELRKDWEQRKNAYFNGDLLSIISATDFLTACTLLSTYQKGGTVSCKKKDVLNLTLDEYQKYADDLTNGFVEAEKILQEERIFSSKDLPYSTQFIPLAVLCTILSKNNQIKTTTIKNKIKQWYWCGVFGEMYGSANETRYVLDVVGVMDWISDDTKVPKTVQDSYFNPTRLLSLASTGVYGLARAVNSEQWYRNIILHDSMYSCDKLLEYVYPELAKQNSWKLPVWYYIANSDYKSSLAESKAPHSYNDIVSEDSIKRNRTAIAGRTAMEIWTQEKTNVFKAIRLLGFLPEDKIDVEQYQQILETIFKENANILSSSNTSDRSSLKRMIRIYDFLLYRQKKTP